MKVAVSRSQWRPSNVWPPHQPVKCALDRAHCSGNQQNENAKRNKNLDHRQHLRPARQQWRVGWPESGALRKSDEEVVDKSWPPACTRKLASFVVRNLHLRKQKAGAAEFLLFMPKSGSAAIQPPVPKREHDDVR